LTYSSTYYPCTNLFIDPVAYSLYLLINYPFADLSNDQFMSCLFMYCQFINLFIYLSIYLLTYLFIYLFIYLCTYLLTYLFMYLCIYLFIGLFDYLLMYLFIHLFI